MDDTGGVLRRLAGALCEAGWKPFVTKEDPGGIVGAAHICKAPQRVLIMGNSGSL
jgi:hypothetical protein